MRPDPVPDGLVADVLDGAADLLDDKGWNKGVFHSPVDGSYCAVGAIRQAAGPLHHPDTFDGQRVWWAQAKLADVVGWIAEFPDDSMTAVVSWNDRDGTTQSDVVDTMRAVAAGLR